MEHGHVLCRVAVKSGGHVGQDARSAFGWGQAQLLPGHHSSGLRAKGLLSPLSHRGLGPASCACSRQCSPATCLLSFELHQHILEIAALLVSRCSRRTYSSTSSRMWFSAFPGRWPLTAHQVESVGMTSQLQMGNRPSEEDSAPPSQGQATWPNHFWE